MKLTNPTKIGMLTITGVSAPDKYGHKRWNYICECGSVGAANEAALIRKNSKSPKSCGCSSVHHITHGRTNEPEYSTWEGMIQRCHNPNNAGYGGYGALGIVVCSRWRGRGGFSNFISDMGDKPAGHTIERENNSLGYSPDNCCWATPFQQARNRRTNRLICFEGKTMTVTDWAKQAGFTTTGFTARLQRGMSFKEALTSPKRRKQCV